MANSWENAQNFCSLLGSQLLEVDGPEEKVTQGGTGDAAVPKLSFVGRGLFSGGWVALGTP